MRIYGIQKLTLLDFPEHTACTLFTGGCNLRCPFCHNASLVLRADEAQELDENEIIAFLKKRRGLLDGVCITGGEPTIQTGLREFIEKIRSLGFLVKLDTNGTRPDVLRELLDGGILDYVAMDIKSSPENYGRLTGTGGFDMAPIYESVSMLMNGDTDFEFRTTAVAGLHTAGDFEKIGTWLRGAPRFFLQSFRDSGDIISDGFSAFSEDELHAFLDILRKYIPNSELRGM